MLFFSVGDLSLLVAEQLLLRRASNVLKFTNQWSRESGSNPARPGLPVMCSGIILSLFNKRGGSRISQNLTFRELSFNMEGMARVAEETASPSTQPESCLRALTLTLSQFGTCPKWEIGSYWQCAGL